MQRITNAPYAPMCASPCPLSSLDRVLTLVLAQIFRNPTHCGCVSTFLQPSLTNPASLTDSFFMLAARPRFLRRVRRSKCILILIPGSNLNLAPSSGAFEITPEIAQSFRAPSVARILEPLQHVLVSSSNGRWIGSWSSVPRMQRESASGRDPCRTSTTTP